MSKNTFNPLFKTVSAMTHYNTPRHSLPQQLKAVGFFFALTLISVARSHLSLSFDCSVCSELSQIQAKLATLTKTMKRLTDILEVNETYLQGLKADADSSRMKAQSNINIAKKRIAQTQEDLEAVNTGSSGEILKNCLQGECAK